MNGKVLFFEYNTKTICALVSDNHLEHLQVMEDSARESILGNIYIGKVQKVVSGIGAAFVDLSAHMTGFLQLTDCKNPLFAEPDKNTPLGAGDELVVQISAEATKTKAPSVTTQLSLVGTYSVVSLLGHGLHFSKKLSADTVEALKSLLKEAAATSLRQFSITIRTNAEQKEVWADLLQEVKEQIAQLQTIQTTYRHRTCYSCLYQNASAYEQAIRLLPMDSYDEIITDRPEIYEILKDWTGSRIPIRFFQDPMITLMNLYGMKQKLEEVLSKKVWLPSGGYLIIEPTEAMTVIDVNSGKIESKKKESAVYLKTNLEAAAEIARQIRIRNLAGIIMVDFINMPEEDTAQMMKQLELCLKKDTVTTRLVDITALGIVEITRKKISRPLWEMMDNFERK